MPPIRHRLAAVSVLALLASAGASPAQEAPWLSPGQTVQGVLEEGDARGAVSNWSDEEHYFDDYLIRIGQGQRFEISLTSEDFDSYLAVYREGGGEDDAPLATDDDGGGYPDALLRFAPPEAGDYRVRVRGFSADALGAYQLSVTQRPAAAPEPSPTPIRQWGAIEGRLGAGDPELEDEQFYDVYSFSARRGDRLRIRLDSEDFDSYLYVGRAASGGGFEELASNDDGGDGFNSLIRFTAPETGQYIIRASSFGSGVEGAYVLTVDEAPPPAPLTPLASGQTIQGVIGEDAALSDFGGLHVPYGFRAQAGDRVAFSLSSEDFDAYLELGREGAGGFEALAYNDDADGLNSRLVHTFEEAGVYELRATSFGGGGTGAYTLSAEALEPEPEPSPLRFGQSLQGRITDDSAETELGGRYDAYRFSGMEGQRVQIIMRSGDFDTYLHIGRAEGEFEALASDDDGLGEGLNSRLNFTLPETGDYIVRASSFGGGGRGLYALEMTDRGPAPVAGSLMIGATVRGHLDENDSMATGDASYYDDYRFQADAGDRLRITMVSNAFDAFLMLGRGLAEDFEIIASDDDGLSDTNSLIEHEIDQSGWYVLRANSYAPGSTGAYVISIERRE